jgi:hypothetical protein
VAPQEPTPVGKLGKKWFFTPPEPARRPLASAAARIRGSVLVGVKRLFRVGSYAALPRAGVPLRQAQRELDSAYERFLETMLLPDSCHGARIAAALDTVAQAQATYAEAGGRVATGGALDTRLAMYRPPFTALSFTDLLSLRQRLPGVRLRQPHGKAIVTHSHHAIETEIAIRERPFKAVLHLLLAGTSMADDLTAALRSLAVAIHHRERHGESPACFLDGLVGRLPNDELAAMAAALATASGDAGRPAPEPRSRKPSVAISAPDGGAQACARVLKDAVDACMRAHLLARARLAFKRGVQDGRDAARVVASVLDGLSAGLAALNGHRALAAGHYEGLRMALFAKALVDDDGGNLGIYLRALDGATLQAVEQYLPALPMARRRRVNLEIDSVKRARAAAAAETVRADRAATRYSTVEQASMRAATLLTRLVDRARSELRKDPPDGSQATVPRGARPHAESELTHMSFDVSAQPDGNYDVSVTARLAREADGRPISLTYNSRVASDLRILKGAFRLES